MTLGSWRYYDHELSVEDYFLSHGREPGVWAGSGAAVLGLSGTVEEGQLARLFDEGRHPISGVPLGVAYRHDSKRTVVTGFALSFSPPKSVSLVGAFGGGEVAGEVRDAHDAAVGAALAFLEDHAAFSRTGRGGVFQVDTGGFVAAAFTNRTSRSGDPQLHSHVLVANKVRCADGRAVAGRPGTVRLPEVGGDALQRHLAGRALGPAGSRVGAGRPERPSRHRRRPPGSDRVVLEAPPGRGATRGAADRHGRGPSGADVDGRRTGGTVPVRHLRDPPSEDRQRRRRSGPWRTVAHRSGRRWMGLLAQAAVGATQWRKATEHVDATRRLARGSPDLPVLAHAEVLAAQVAIGQAHFAKARALAERALDAAERLGWPKVACEALEVIGRVARLGDVDEAEQVFERARTLALEHGLTLWQLRALHELGTIDVHEGRSLTRLVETREMALRVGALATAAVAELHLAAMLSTRFDADGTFEAAGRCVEVSRRFHLGTLPAALVFLASSWAIRGDRDRAEAGIEEALRAGGDDPDVSGRTWAWVRAILSLLEEDHVRALAELDRGVEVMRPSGLGPHPFAGLWVLLHAVCDDDPDRPRAEIRALGSRVAVYNRAYLAYSDAVVLGRAGASDEAMKSLALAEEHFAQSEGRDWLRQFARRLVAEAAIADGWGDPETWLRGCLGFFDRRGDLRIAAACRSLLRRAGAPVPRRGRGDATVPQGLRAMGVTSREMDVLALVAAGLTNRAIAERLFISPRTVETHVASLVRKMRVEGRQGLMALTTSGSPQP